MNTRRRQLAQNSADFLEWIWHRIDDGGPGFVEWLRTNEPIFWITGKPASGKSTLMTYISEHESIQDLLSTDKAPNWFTIHFYFDFRVALNKPNSIEGLLRTLLFQLAGASPRAEKAMRKDKHGRDVDFRYANLHQQELCRLLKVASQAATKTHRICAFIDGLDEYAGRATEIMQMIQFLNTNGFKTCVASRPEHAMVQHLGSRPHMLMQDHNSDTIKAYVDYTIHKLPPNITDMPLKELALRVVERAEGVILWAQLVMTQLIDCILAGGTTDEVHSQLAEFPNELNEVYERLLQGVDLTRQIESAILLTLIQSASSTATDATIWALHRAMVYLRDSEVLTSWPKQTLNLKLFLIRLRARTGSMIDIVSTIGRSSHIDVINFASHNDDEDLFSSLDLRARLFHKTLDNYLRTSMWAQKFVEELNPSINASNIWLTLYTDCILENELTSESCSEVVNYLLAGTPLTFANDGTAHEPNTEHDRAENIAYTLAQPHIVDTGKSFIDCAVGSLHQTFQSLSLHEIEQVPRLKDALGTTLMLLHPWRDSLRSFHGPHIRCECYPHYGNNSFSTVEEFDLSAFNFAERQCLFALTHRMFEHAGVWITQSGQPARETFCHRVFAILLDCCHPSSHYSGSFRADFMLEHGTYVDQVVDNIAHCLKDEQIISLLTSRNEALAIRIFTRLEPSLRVRNRPSWLNKPFVHASLVSLPPQVFRYGYNIIFVWACTVSFTQFHNKAEYDNRQRQVWLSKLVHCGWNLNTQCSWFGPLLHTVIELLPACKEDTDGISVDGYNITQKLLDVTKLIHLLLQEGASLRTRGPRGTPSETACKLRHEFAQRISDSPLVPYYSRHWLHCHSLMSHVIDILTSENIRPSGAATPI